MKLFELLFKTVDSYAPLISRLILGIAMFPHGAQKVLGWYGGHGFSATMKTLTESMQLPTVIAFLVIVAEFAGSIALVLGFLSRLAALGIGSVMIGAILTVHAAHGFFMNWSGKQEGEGFEYHLLAIGLALVVVIYGGGKASVDAMIARRCSARSLSPTEAGQ